MKKTVLTFVAVAFGTCVAFAQTTPETDQQQNTEQSITVDKMSDKPEDAGRRTIKVEELPEAIQTNLKGEDFKAYSVVSVTEVQPQPGTAATTVQYEVALAEGTDTTAEPSVLVLFDDQGKVVSQKDPAAMKGEEDEE